VERTKLWIASGCKRTDKDGDVVATTVDDDDAQLQEDSSNIIKKCSDIWVQSLLVLTAQK
jgi:hypothetical protein